VASRAGRGGWPYPEGKAKAAGIASTAQVAMIVGGAQAAGQGIHRFV
jgi:hypothetical protein